MNKEELMKLEKEEIIAFLLGIIEQQASKIKEITTKIEELKAQLNQNSKKIRAVQ